MKTTMWKQIGLAGLLAVGVGCAIGLAGQHGTGFDCATIQMHRAGATLARIAADVGARETEVLP